jgi:hypothetical protein
MGTDILKKSAACTCIVEYEGSRFLQSVRTYLSKCAVPLQVGDLIHPGVPGKCLVVWIVKRCFAVTCRIQFGMPDVGGQGVIVYSRLSYGISTELSFYR